MRTRSVRSSGRLKYREMSYCCSTKTTWEVPLEVADIKYVNFN